MAETLYLNTDLELASSRSLGPLIAQLSERGVFVLSETRPSLDECWICLETERSYSDLSSNIAAFLDVIEDLPPREWELWNACSLREFNVGYECAETWAFGDGIAAQVLQRIALAGATFRLTLYPAEPESDPSRTCHNRA